MLIMGYQDMNSDKMNTGYIYIIKKSSKTQSPESSYLDHLQAVIIFL